jgi:hypothetical protein
LMDRGLYEDAETIFLDLAGEEEVRSAWVQ